MRSDREIERAIEMVESRIDRDTEYDEHPLTGVVLAIHQAKRAALFQVQNDDANGWELYDQARQSLQYDLSMKQYIQTQAMINTLKWAFGKREGL